MNKSDKSGKKKLKILVPTNFSGHAITAAEYAIELFKDIPGEFILENVFQVPKWSAGTLISIHDIVSKEVDEKLNKECELIKSKYKKVDITIQADEGNAISAIRNTLKKKQIDLLVIGHNSHVKGFFSAFEEQPQYWPVLLVPNPLASAITDEVIIVSAEKDETLGKTGFFTNLDEQFKGKLQYINFKNYPELKASISEFQKKNKVGLVIFNVSAESRLEQAIREHNLDTILLSLPSLLISYNK